MQSIGICNNPAVPRVELNWISVKLEGTAAQNLLTSSENDVLSPETCSLEVNPDVWLIRRIGRCRCIPEYHM